MQLKVHMGTPKGRDSLCRFCAKAQIIRGVDLQVVQECHAGNITRQIKFPVETCNQFEDARLPSLDDMKKIAWTVETRNRGKWGFKGGAEEPPEREVTIEPPRHDHEYLQPATTELVSD